jgi:hypothetical protein
MRRARWRRSRPRGRSIVGARSDRLHRCTAQVMHIVQKGEFLRTMRAMPHGEPPSAETLRPGAVVGEFSVLRLDEPPTDRWKEVCPVRAAARGAASRAASCSPEFGGPKRVMACVLRECDSLVARRRFAR